MRPPVSGLLLPGHQLPLVAPFLEGVSPMDQPYSVWADLLAKFHASSDLIQALWLITVSGMVLGMAYLVLRAIRDVLAVLTRRAGEWRLVYGVYQDASGQWMVYS